MTIVEFFFSIVLLVCFLLLSDAEHDEALITQLPGYDGSFPSKHYSGYISIDEKDGKNLFYYFVVSERNPSEDPVVLWLNGGPGCSSFDGFVFGHGPFDFKAGEIHGSLPKLHLNKYSWSKVSNIIYLDSPAGVGFSYSVNQRGYTTNDKKTANDTHTFLLKWFKEYKDFQSNPFYVSGESYAGVYVPTLAHKVVEGIGKRLEPIINFKGYMVGNGVTDKKFDGNARVTFAHGMGLITHDLFQEANTSCQGTYLHPIINGDCKNSLDKVNGVIKDLNIYNILKPCHHSHKAREISDRVFGRAWPLKVKIIDGSDPTCPPVPTPTNCNENAPCTNDEIATSWLTNEAVRKALHVRQESFRWVICTCKVNYKPDCESMISYHKDLTTRGYRALIYSGDHDMCVPYTGSEAWTKSLGYKIVDEWRPWFSSGQVAGYIQGYENNLTFLTIKGSGHTVPEDKPHEALEFYSRWLAGAKI